MKFTTISSRLRSAVHTAELLLHYFALLIVGLLHSITASLYRAVERLVLKTAKFAVDRATALREK